MNQPVSRVDYGKIEFRVRRSILHQLADQAGAAVPTRETLLVIGCFRVTVSPGRVELAATDMQRTIFAETTAVDTQDSGVVFVPAQRLRSILGEAPDGEVTVLVSGEYATVSAGGTDWAIKLPPTRGHAELLDPAAVSFAPVGREALLGALKTVGHAVSKDTGRPAFTQVRIAKEGDGLYAWASDSSQFSRAPVAGFPFATRIPGAMLKDLVRLLGAIKDEEVLAGEAGLTVVFRIGPVTLAAQQMAQEFPDMSKMLLEPTAGHDAVLAADRAELLAAIRRVAINAHPQTSAMALVAEPGRLTVQTRDDDGNKAEETVAATWSGPRRKLVVNHRFLADMAAVHPAATCTFRLGPDKGRVLSMIRLDDPDTGVIGAIPQMQPGAMA